MIRCVSRFLVLLFRIFVCGKVFWYEEEIFIDLGRVLCICGMVFFKIFRILWMYIYLFGLWLMGCCKLRVYVSLNFILKFLLFLLIMFCVVLFRNLSDLSMLCLIVCFLVIMCFSVMSLNDNICLGWIRRIFFLVM